MSFLEGYGASTASFMADFFKGDREVFAKQCYTLGRAGKINRWYFDGRAMWGLHQHTPPNLPPETQTGKRRRIPRK